MEPVQSAASPVSGKMKRDAGGLIIENACTLLAKGNVQCQHFSSGATSDELKLGLVTFASEAYVLHR